MLAFHYDTIDSTNDEAKRLLDQGKITEDAFIVAREQTAGRGRLGHRWVSPLDAGIYLTVIQPGPREVLPETTMLTLAAGVACVKAIERETGLSTQLKPINDLVIDKSKLGGILTESLIQQGKMLAVLTGIGINVHPATRQVESGALPPTCLADHLSKQQMQQLDLNALVARLVTEIITWNSRVYTGQIDIVKQSWQAHSIASVSIFDHN